MLPLTVSLLFIHYKQNFGTASKPKLDKLVCVAQFECFERRASYDKLKYEHTATRNKEIS